MTNPNQIPPISDALLDFLEAAYPERCADPKDTDREIWMKAGERRLVARLRHVSARQQSPSGVTVR